jgi:hypothetical protein
LCRRCCCCRQRARGGGGGRGDLEAEEGEHAAGDAQDVGGDLVPEDATIEPVRLLLVHFPVDAEPQVSVVLPAQLPKAHLRVEVLQVGFRDLVIH